MRVQAFITSGILEKYVLGMTTPEESQEVLERASQHMEVKEELAAIRQTMRGYILSHQVAPPPALKERVLPIANRQSVHPNKNEALTQASAVKLSPSKKDKGNNGSNAFGIVAALLGLSLIAACFLAYTFYTETEGERQAKAAALEEAATLRKQLETEQKRAQDLQSQLDFYHDRNNNIIVLKGTYRSPESRAFIYWNPQKSTASVDVANLPTMREGSVAVIWANTGSLPNKIGVLAPSPPSERSELTFVEDPIIFYVTEENSPEVERPNRAKILMTGNF